MKDVMTYANEAGFFSFNVIGWKAEFERLIEAVRADALAKLATVKESLTAQSSDHFAASGKVMLTAEQAQQIDEIVEHLLVDHPTARHHKACVEALSIIRAARAQFISKKQETESPDFLEGYNAGISDSKRLLSRIQEPVGEIVNKYGDPESFAEHGLEIGEKIIQSLPIGSKIYASPVFETRVDIDGMVNRFLGWKLPKDFYPDCGIEFHRIGKPSQPNYGRFSYEPVGTNLFTADQAKAMFEYCCSTQQVEENNKC